MDFLGGGRRGTRELQRAFDARTPLNKVAGITDVIETATDDGGVQTAVFDNSTLAFAGDLLYGPDEFSGRHLLTGKLDFGIACVAHIVEGIIFFDKVATGPDGCGTRLYTALEEAEILKFLNPTPEQVFAALVLAKRKAEVDLK